MKPNYTTAAILGLTIALGAAWASPVRADDDANGTGSAQQSLDERVSALEQRLSLLSPVSGTATAFQGSPATAFASVDRGIGFVSSDGKYGIQFSGTLQEDYRAYLYDGLNSVKGETANTPDEFVLARARLLIDAFLGPRVHVRYQEDFSNNGSNSGSSALSPTASVGAQLVDAYGELRLLPWTLLRVGQFKSGLDIERFRQTPAADWIQFGYTAGLVVDRTQGAELEIADPNQYFYLSGGLIDGDTDTAGNAVEGAVGDTDSDNKDGIVRLFVQPLNAVPDKTLGNLALGVSASGGNHSGDAWQGYKSLGQLSIVSAPSGNVAGSFIEGAGYRVVPQAYWFWKQFNVLGEYIHESDGVRLDGTNQNEYVDSDAWDVSAGWAVTGEHPTYSSGLKLDKNSYAWGALQVVARIEGADFDEGDFTSYKPGLPVSAGNVAHLGLLDPVASVERLTSWSVGLNYVPVNDVKFLLDYDVTQFTGGGENLAGGVDVLANRPTEEILQARAQFAF